jgi:hypothetical protein
MTQRHQGRGLTPHPEDERALARIKFEASEWDQLNWYVQFAAKRIKQLSPGERLSLREEARAVERTLARRIGGAESVPEIDDDELQRLHGFFSKKLLELVTTGHVTLGPFELRILITFGLVSETVGGKGLLGNRFLTYHFAKLLTWFPDAIRGCPHCNNIFLRFRRNAIYCSRACQSVAVMRQLRGVRKNIGRGIKREHMRNIPKGRAEHGKTRR